MGMPRVLINGSSPRGKSTEGSKPNLSAKGVSSSTLTQLRKEVGEVENAVWQLLERYRELERLVPSIECYFRVDRNIVGAGNFAMARLGKMREMCEKVVGWAVCVM